METIDFSSYIEKYIAGEMSNTERRWFEKELEGSEILRKEVELRKKTELILRNMDHLSLRGKLSEIERERAYPGKKVRKGVPAYLKYAAVISLIVAIGTLTYQPWSGMSNEEVVSKYYRSYEPPTARRSGGAETNTMFSMALELYNAQNYDKAAQLFSKVIENNPKDMQSMLLNGVANFETSNYPQAKQSFNKVIDDNNNLFIDQAEWYLALCFIKTGEIEKAKIRLTAIKAGEGIYRSEAKDILRKLKL
jgi:tetratricopeptide (TPR) repeat protein